jgi:hypothetical protein
LIDEGRHATSNEGSTALHVAAMYDCACSEECSLAEGSSLAIDALTEARSAISLLTGPESGATGAAGGAAETVSVTRRRGAGASAFAAARSGDTDGGRAGSDGADRGGIEGSVSASRRSSVGGAGDGASAGSVRSTGRQPVASGCAEGD